MKLTDFPEILYATSKSPDGNMKFSQGNLKETLDNREKFLGTLNISLDSILDSNVQHGTEIYKVKTKDLKKGAYEDNTALKVDGLITNEPNIYLFLTTADCLPIAAYDPKNKAIGLIHAGWRGIDLGVIKTAITKMQKEFNTTPKDLVVQIGPSIGSCCYKTDLWEEAEDQLLKLGVSRKNIENPRICTYENKEYFSHREAEDKKLSHDYRFATILGIKK